MRVFSSEEERPSPSPSLVCYREEFSCALLLQYSTTALLTYRWKPSNLIRCGTIEHQIRSADPRQLAPMAGRLARLRDAVRGPYLGTYAGSNLRLGA